jgi:hypothetical protein
MFVVPGIQGPDGTARTGTEAPTLPVHDGAFAKELTKRAAAPSAPRVLEATRTHLSGGEAAHALDVAWQQRFGDPAPAGALEVLVAGWAHETGGGRAMMNYNFGGIKGTGPSGLSAAYLTHEGSGATERTIVDRFRAYGSAVEGAADYVGLLAQRFPKALEAARRGDPADFVKALKQGGYFTGSEEAYTQSVVSLTQRAHTHGFDAIGAAARESNAVAVEHLAAAPSARLTAAPAAAATPEAAHLAAFAPTAATPATLAHADALAMADELSRAALRIAASGLGRADDDV